MELTRKEALRRQWWLTGVTIGWNSVEGVVAVIAGVAAGSVSLIGFGLDSGIEVSAALVLVWRLAQERHSRCMKDADRLAQRLIAVSFGALAVYVAVESVRDLVSADRSEVSFVGIAVAVLSLVGMPILARAKMKLASVVGSRAAKAEATQAFMCALLSGGLLVGLAANAIFGWWWADPLAGLFIAVVAVYGAVIFWRPESLADAGRG